MLLVIIGQEIAETASTHTLRQVVEQGFYQGLQSRRVLCVAFHNNSVIHVADISCLSLFVLKCTILASDDSRYQKEICLKK